MILNEPLVFLLAGYLDAQIPPGLSDTRSLNRVFDHLLAAHCAAAGEIRVRNRHAAFSIAHNMMGFAPQRESNPLDGLLARTAHTMYNRGDHGGLRHRPVEVPPAARAPPSAAGATSCRPGSTPSASTSIHGCTCAVPAASG